MIETQDELLLSELIDGRPVDPDRLAHVLETTAGRVSLVAFARLRADLIADAAAPGEGFVARVEERLRAPRRRARLAPLVAVAGGLLLGVALTLVLRPAASPSPEGITSLQGESAPEAVRVLRFEPGTDWTELGS